jgi:hypothetical protein
MVSTLDAPDVATVGRPSSSWTERAGAIVPQFEGSLCVESGYSGQAIRLPLLCMGW